MNAIHCLMAGIAYLDRDRGLENLSSPRRRRPSRNTTADGVLFENPNPEQVQLLNQILMHE
ncbi:MAG: hypothetical protein OXG77_04575 [Chloroflexi bacterium]|nr:hypothetical protein [Chloroflexota bacterium]